MAYDPVLDREMFRPKSRGVDALRESEDPEVVARRERALAMIEMAKQKFDPANYQTLSEQNRPGVFRPVAVNMPAQQQTADTAMRMQQMAAQGIRPMGFEKGGIATIKEFIESGFGADSIPFLRDLRRRNAEAAQSSGITPTITTEPTNETGSDTAPQESPDSDIPSGRELGLDRDLTQEEKDTIRQNKRLFELGAMTGTGGRLLNMLKPKPKALEKGSSGIPTVRPPKEGEPGFVGPVQPPKPGDPRFVGPYQSGGQGSSGIPSVSQRTPTSPAVPSTRLAGEQAISNQTGISSLIPEDDVGDGTTGGPPRRLSGKRPIKEAPNNVEGGKKQEKSNEDAAKADINAIKEERARQREENFNLALIRAGLGMAAGKSSNALANIGEGGIAGLEQFAAAEKADRAFNAEERKLAEDREARLLRSRELAQDKALARETRVYDIASGNIRSYLSDIKDYQNLLKDISLSEDQKKEIYGKIEDLQQRVDYERDVINQSQKRLGIDVPPFPERGKGTVSPTIDFSGLPPS